jgi:uncharacterized membrane protein YdjX (TVP38/TMEM64 family)
MAPELPPVRRRPEAGGNTHPKASGTPKYLLPLLLSGIVAAGAAWYFAGPIWDLLHRGWRFLADRAAVEAYIASFGLSAPLIFMALQVLQVVFAPVPGEATGFIGGYLFGTGLGFLYSSLALTAGSGINFAIGRFLGKRYVRKLIPAEKLARFDSLLKHQGLIVVFWLFVLPGFPKDYLSLFLGISSLPWKAFMIMAAIGRMPGTLLLSMQGAAIYERMYGVFGLVLGVCLLAGLLAYRFREEIYRWVERMNSH